MNRVELQSEKSVSELKEELFQLNPKPEYNPNQYTVSDVLSIKNGKQLVVYLTGKNTQVVHPPKELIGLLFRNQYAYLGKEPSRDNATGFVFQRWSL